MSESKPKKRRHGAVNPGWPQFERYTFEPAVRSGNLLFISGLTATDVNAQVIGKGDIVAQTRFIYRQIGKILDAAGASPSDVVKTTDFITTTENYDKTAEVRREFFGGTYPASTGVVVNRLLRRDALIEIETIVALPDENSGGNED